VATDTSSQQDVDRIRREMAQIRRELHEDMQGVVAGAEAVADWRRYVKLYPWASVAAAFAFGFWVVPKRRRSVTEAARKAAEETAEKVVGAVQTAQVKKVVPVSEATAEKKEKRAGLIGMAFGMLSPIVVRAAQSYAVSYVENWIAQQQQAMGGPPPGPGAGAMSGGGMGRPSPSQGPPRPPGGGPPVF
jgi:hypothetical protein